MNRTQVKILLYLQAKARKGEIMPSLPDLAKELNVNYSTLSDNLGKLRKMGKINYKCGKILNVYAETPKGNIEFKPVEQHKTKYGVKELEEKYDKCVKEIVCEYINKIDASSFTNENINKIVNGITTLTNNLKERLFK